MNHSSFKRNYVMLMNLTSQTATTQPFDSVERKKTNHAFFSSLFLTAVVILRSEAFNMNREKKTTIVKMELNNMPLFRFNWFLMEMLLVCSAFYFFFCFLY